MFATLHLVASSSSGQPRRVAITTFWDGSRSYECALPLWCQSAARLSAVLPEAIAPEVTLTLTLTPTLTLTLILPLSLTLEARRGAARAGDSAGGRAPCWAISPRPVLPCKKHDLLGATIPV